MAGPKPSLHDRLRDLSSFNDIAKELNGIEARVIEQIARDLATAREATIERLAQLTGTFDIAQAQLILAEIERQQAEFELVWENIMQDSLRDALEAGGEFAPAKLRSIGIEISAKPFISTQFLEVAAATLPHLIRGLSQEFIADIGRVLRQATLAQMTPLDVIRAIGKLPPFQVLDPTTGLWRPLTEKELQQAMAAKGPYAKLFRRMEAIMRTEIGRIAQTANYLTLRELQQSDRRWRKVWDAVRDHRTRDTHAAADGQKRRVNEDFRVGGARMAFPLDPRAPAAETVNCRCIMLPWHPVFDDPSLAKDDPNLGPVARPFLIG